MIFRARLLFGACCLGLLFSCAPETSPIQPFADEPVEAGPAAFQIVITGDVGGELSSVRDEGGLARNVEHARGAEVVLDVGDRFFRAYRIAKDDQPAALRAAQALGLGLKRSRAQAMVVAERDLALGLPVLRDLAKVSGVRLLSANLRFADSGSLAFDGFMVIKGPRLGVVAASAVFDIDDPQREAYTWANLETTPPGPALKTAIRAAKEQGALQVIGLLHMPLAQARAMLKSHALDLDYVVVAHDRGGAIATETLATVADRGRSQLWLQVDSGRITARTATMTVDLPQDVHTQSTVARALRRVAPTHSRNVGAKTCAKTCHPAALRHWKKTRHAKAWSGLRKERQTRNRDCTSCHATPLAKRGPKSVSCESCHGTLQAHAKEPQEVPAGAVPKEVCAQCHRAQAEQRPFVAETWWPKILGPGHGVE